MSKKVFIRTFGCQMNIRDSEYVMGLFLESGFKAARSPEEADVILFNSCSVRKHAEDRLFSNIADLKYLKDKRPGLVIGLMGCTAQSYKEAAFRRMPAIDLVCGPGDEPDLPRLVSEAMEGYRVVATDNVNRRRPGDSPAFRVDDFKTYVSISEGCNNFCAYCIVPYLRGSERSRRESDIIKEVKDLAARGFKEITLLGQNVNSYGKDRRPQTKDQRPAFVKLLEKLNRIDGIERIRFMTSHPKDASLELFKAMGRLEKVCGHLHLPVQSGSDKVLKAMNRGYTVKKYRKLIEDYRKIVPNGTITTDIIVGFPGETERDFRKTFELIRGMEFDNVYMFKYSPRPPAKSASLKDDVLAEDKQARLASLLELQSGISERYNAHLVGSVFEVLVDGLSRKERSRLTGRTKTNKITVFNGPKKLVGSLVQVKVVSATPHALIGELKI